MPAPTDQELELIVASTRDELVLALAAETLRARRTLRQLRGYLGVYDPGSVQRAYQLVVETVGEGPASNV